MYILKVITVLVQRVSYSNVQIKMTSCFIVGNKYFCWNKQTIYFIWGVLCWANWVLPWYTPECAVQYLFCNITYKPYDSYILHIKHTDGAVQPITVKIIKTINYSRLRVFTYLVCWYEMQLSFTNVSTISLYNKKLLL